MNLLRSVVLLSAAASLLACEKNATQIDDVTVPAQGARITFANFGVNAPQVHFFANDQRLTATGSAANLPSPVGLAFGAVSGGGVYRLVAPGQYTLTARLSDTATANRDVVVASVAASLADGKSYTFYTSGIYDATARRADAFVVEDPISDRYNWTVGTVRFVNAISNSQPMQLFARNTTTSTEVPIGGPIAYKSAGTYVTLEPGSYDLFVRAPGGTATLISRTQVSFIGGRTYTVSARGDMTVTSTTAVNRPFLDNTVNR